MPIFHNLKYTEVSTSGGSFSYATGKVRGFIRQIIVKPATSSTTFDMFISDGSSLHLFERESEVDELNETVNIPVQSNLFLTVLNATRDELFKVYLAIQES